MTSRGLSPRKIPVFRFSNFDGLLVANFVICSLILNQFDNMKWKGLVTRITEVDMTKSSVISQPCWLPRPEPWKQIEPIMKRQVLTLLALLCNQITALNSRFIAEDEKDYYGVDSSIERFFSATVQPVFEADQMMDRYRRSTNPPITAPAHHSHTNNWAVLVRSMLLWQLKLYHS